MKVIHSITDFFENEILDFEDNTEKYFTFIHYYLLLFFHL